jgi:hypothetical protein
MNRQCFYLRIIHIVLKVKEMVNNFHSVNFCMGSQVLGQYLWGFFRERFADTLLLCF